MNQETKKLYEAFVSYLKKSKSPHTARLYSRSVKEFLEYLDKPLDKVTTLDISAWQDKLLERVGSRSVETMSAALKTFFKAIGRYDIAMAVPSIRYEARPINWLPEEKVIEVIEAADPGLHQAVLATGYELALRVGEVVLLERGWFNPKARVCKVRRLKRKGSIPLEDVLPMREYFAEKLQAYLESRDDSLNAMFVSRGKFGVEEPRPLTERGVNYIYHLAAKRVGLNTRKYSWHAFARHSRLTNYAVQLMKETGTADPLKIMKFAGHVNIKSTMVYVHLAPTLLT
ncbi:MAG: tyrosine-type recombinase/integrase [Thermoproteota archaeon]